MNEKQRMTLATTSQHSSKGYKRN